MIVFRAALQEALNRRILGIGAAVSVAFVGLFWFGFSTAFSRVAADTGDELATIAATTVMTVLGLYAVQFLAAFLAILLAAGSIAGELESGRALQVLARPIPRWSWLLQRTAAFGGLSVGYVVIMTAGVLGVAGGVGGYGALSPVRGMALMSLEVLVLVALAVALSTRLGTVATGVVVVALYGLAWLAGIMEFVGRIVDNPAVERIGVAVSLLMPSDALWRGASFHLQSPAFLLSPDGDVGIPFAAVDPPSVMLIAWSLLYATVLMVLAVRSLRRRDL
ncbi:hypothetical protein [Euzebya rosea]|uniref:hypothetical protein n=1 Tax=Euzebya rosea TaxID=2052804 RepID=UPI000D3E6953|nr:hypothetical protein [Euzebya rosea]